MNLKSLYYKIEGVVFTKDRVRVLTGIQWTFFSPFTMKTKMLKKEK